MRASRWQVSLLCGALVVACGSSDGASRSGELSQGDPSNSAKTQDAGRGADGGKKSFIDPTECQTIQLPSNPDAPEILIVQDRSGSMVGRGDIRNAGKNRWKPSVSALKTLTSELSSSVAFGLMLFPSSSAGSAPPTGGPGCEAGKVDVPVATNNADQIASALDRSTPDVGATPTAASLMAALDALVGQGACPDCPVKPKYVLLVTDGQPTCGLGGTRTEPQDIEATQLALDALREAGIKTYVIGYDSASDAEAARAMDAFAQRGGTDRHLPVEDEASLLAELTRIAGALVPCEFELNDDVENPSFVRVELDGVSYEFGKDWELDGRTVRLHRDGEACLKLRDARLHRLIITRECAPVTVI